MAGLTADQIIERIANANGTEPEVIRRQTEQTIVRIMNEPGNPGRLILAELFSCGRLTLDALVVALEYELYDAMMPVFPGWEWDGEGYRNIRVFRQKQ